MSAIKRLLHLASQADKFAYVCLMEPDRNPGLLVGMAGSPPRILHSQSVNEAETLLEAFVVWVKENPQVHPMCVFKNLLFRPAFLEQVDFTVTPERYVELVLKFRHTAPFKKVYPLNLQEPATTAEFINDYVQLVDMIKKWQEEASRKKNNDCPPPPSFSVH